MSRVERYAGNAIYGARAIRCDRKNNDAAVRRRVGDRQEE